MLKDNNLSLDNIDNLNKTECFFDWIFYGDKWKLSDGLELEDELQDEVHLQVRVRHLTLTYHNKSIQSKKHSVLFTRWYIERMSGSVEQPSPTSSKLKMNYRWPEYS